MWMYKRIQNNTLPETNSSPLKRDGLEYEFPFCDGQFVQLYILADLDHFLAFTNGACFQKWIWYLLLPPPGLLGIFPTPKPLCQRFTSHTLAGHGDHETTSGLSQLEDLWIF